MNKQKSTEWKPSPKQQAVLEAAHGQGVNRTISAVCQEAGVDRTSFYKWMREDPGFVKAWDAVWYGTVRRHLPGAIQALAQKAQEGDVPAIKLLTELAGVYRGRLEVESKGVPISEVLDDDGD